jgi:isoaspartyl peptidase/L-asparaginase-like protein (Ntn-hydrolase superfamily)
MEPLVLSTWKHGYAANEAAWKILSRNGKAIDAVEEGVKVSEADPKVINVGYGGLPDASGKVTLDASIMGPNGHAGAVVFLEHIRHPISVARLVMEKTEHVILAGEGALAFALENGFEKEELLTPYARDRWLRWRENMEEDKDRLGIQMESHDTIGMLAIDTRGDLAGACTTSGVAWKVRGRVGDTPVIGAGLYVDNEIGAAAGTGRGELILQVCGSFLIVEKLREGKAPQAACEAAVQRILSMRDKGQIKNPDGPTFQAGFIAVNKKGEYGAASIKKGFPHAVRFNGKHELVESKYFLND